MSLGINTTLSMLNASLGVNESQRSLADAMKRIASGRRINSGADDPAGLVITEKMNAKLVGLGAAVANNEGVSNMIRTADAAAGQIGDLLQKARSLALDASNTGVNDADMQKANQDSFNEVVKSVKNIAENTQFGSKKLLDGSFTVTPTVGPDGETANVNVDRLDPSSLGSGAKYTAADGTTKAVDKFKNLGELGDALKIGDQDTRAQAVAVVDKAISQVAQTRGKLGALESDFIRPMTENFQSSYQQLQESESAIGDSDMALEMSRVSRENIRSQVRLALMAQGKDNSQTLLQLLM